MRGQPSRNAMLLNNNPCSFNPVARNQFNNMHGDFVPSTPNNINQFHTGVNITANLPQSFGENRPLIDAQDYMNKGLVLHNNLGDKLQVERVVEYRVQISSIDRDICAFPNMFDMKVSLGNENFSPHVGIQKKFKNIRYVTLNSVMLPRTIAIDTSNSYPDCDECNKCKCHYQDIYPTLSPIKCPLPNPPSTPLHSLEFHPYLVLKINELSTENSRASTDFMDRDAFVLIPDQKLGDMYLWKPRRSTVVYPNSLLTNLKQLSLLLVDERGRKLSIYDECGRNIIRHPLGTCVCDDYLEYVEKHKCTNDMVDYTNSVTQVIYDFTFGIIENELNTVTNFS